jgi:hypothetical protein
MLGWKLESIDLFSKLSESGLPLNTKVPVGAIVFTTSTTIPSGWTFLPGNSGVLRGRAAAYYGATTSGVPPAVYPTIASAGNHSGPGDVPTADNSVLRSTSYSIYNQSAGAHTHSIGNVLSGYTPRLPDSVFLGMINASSVNSTVLPVNSIVFSASKPATDFSLVSTYDGRYLAAPASLSGAGTTVNASTGNTWYVQTGSGGNHLHGTSTYGYNSNTQASRAPYTTIGSAGSHAHSVLMTGRQQIGNYTTVTPYVSNGNAVITSGCIIGWAGTSTTLPQGWVFCDGSTVRGITTPNLNGDKFINLSSTSHGVSYIGDDYVSYGVSSWGGAQHSHASSSGTSAGTFTSGNQHSTFAWDHSHYFNINSLPSGIQTTLPLSMAISFIMYAP